MSRPAAQHFASPARTVGRFSVRVSDTPDDPVWDAFVERATGGSYTQTSCWGRVRASIGWRPVRVVISGNGEVVAGVQILTRPLPAAGNVGRVSWGPVVSGDDPELVALVFDEMLALGRAENVQYLVVHAPLGGDWMCAELERRGLRPSDHEVEYTATVRLDLRPDIDELLAGMNRRCREHLRVAERRGVTVRRGTRADLPILNRLKDAHSARLGYPRQSEAYFAELWRSLEPRGHIALFLAEYEGEAVAAELAIPFGDTCYHVERLWSGEHGDLRPNELIEWRAFQWAKSEGYRFVDLVGIQRSVAEAMLAGDRRPPGLTSAESFKLRFGAGPVLLPRGYDHVYNPALRLAYRTAPRGLLSSASMGKLRDRVRALAWGRRET